MFEDLHQFDYSRVQAYYGGKKTPAEIRKICEAIESLQLALPHPDDLTMELTLEQFFTPREPA